MTIERLPLTPAQQDAFRAYMHDLNRQAAIAQGVDPDTICPQCGEDLPHDHDEVLEDHNSEATEDVIRDPEDAYLRSEVDRG